MHDLLLSPPWWLSVMVLIVGASVFYFGNANRQSKVRLAGVIVLLLSVVMFLLGYFIETDVEKVRRLTRDLVQSVPAKNWVQMTSLLDPDATLLGYTGRDKIVEGAKANTDRWQIKSVSITAISAKPDQSGMIIADITVMADSDATMGYKTPSSWRIFWDKTGEDWHVHEIDCTKIGNEPPSSIPQLIGK